MANMKWFWVVLFCLGLGILTSVRAAEPILLTELNNGADKAWEIELWGDGSTVYFGRQDSALGRTQIYQAQWTYPHGSLTNVRALSELDQGQSLGTPRLSSDGLRMYYHEQQSNGQYYLRSASRNSINDTWTIGTIFTELHQYNWNDFHPSISNDELTIYWNSFSNAAGAQIYKATRQSITQPFSSPVLVDGVYIDYWTGGPYVLNDQKTMYFTSANDLYRATRNNISDPFGNVTFLSDVNTLSYPEWGPTVSPDGKYLYFYSERAELGTGIWMVPIPEPMTVMLLSLGGIFALRGKKRKN